MTIKRCISICLMVFFGVSLMTDPVLADRGKGRHEPRGKKYYRERGYKLDKRHRHNRYYPPRGTVVKSLPRGHRIVPYRHSNFYFHSGIWYRSLDRHFSVVLPPVGLAVPVLPPYYSTVWVGGLPYYYAGGVYYIWHPEERSYIVTSSPPQAEVIEEQGAPQQLFVYPKNNQSEEQQATDRYECHRWSREQTGFDPTRPGGNVAPEHNRAKRADYQRAMKACLEARDYSVQ